MIEYFCEYCGRIRGEALIEGAECSNCLNETLKPVWLKRDVEPVGEGAMFIDSEEA